MYIRRHQDKRLRTDYCTILHRRLVRNSKRELAGPQQLARNNWCASTGSFVQLARPLSQRGRHMTHAALPAAAHGTPPLTTWHAIPPTLPTNPAHQPCPTGAGDLPEHARPTHPLANNPGLPRSPALTAHHPYPQSTHARMHALQSTTGKVPQRVLNRPFVVVWSRGGQSWGGVGRYVGWRVGRCVGCGRRRDAEESGCRVVQGGA